MPDNLDILMNDINAIQDQHLPSVSVNRVVASHQESPSRSCDFEGAQSLPSRSQGPVHPSHPSLTVQSQGTVMLEACLRRSLAFVAALLPEKLTETNAFLAFGRCSVENLFSGACQA